MLCSNRLCLFSHPTLINFKFVVIYSTCFLQIEALREYRVRFSSSSSSFHLGVPPCLANLLPQALSREAVPEEVLLGEVEASPKDLQVIERMCASVVIIANIYYNAHLVSWSQSV